ncbi:hypothetical protein JTB14_011901 [Gonioctena quinquepunctata]|nr:hypothetical protein JTB14_011901 [Gonioctena quinquepunctata]
MSGFAEPVAGHRELQDILCEIWSCVVCLDLPRAAVYHCSNGHLMCAGCFSDLRDTRTATCPTCRVEISKTSATRTWAIEEAILKLRAEFNGQLPTNLREE